MRYFEKKKWYDKQIRSEKSIRRGGVIFWGEC